MQNFGNILENENDINSSDTAIKTLENSIKNYKKTGGRGEIDKKNAEKTKLEKKLEECKIDEKNLNERKQINEKLKETINEKAIQLEKLNKMLNLKLEAETQNAKKENLKMLKENVQKSKKNIDEYNLFFKDQIPTEEEIKILMDKCLLLEKNKTEENNNKFEEEIQEIETKISNLQKKEESVEKDNINTIICIACVILIIIGIILFAKNILIGATTLTAIGVICFIIFALRKSKTNKKVKKNKEIQNEIEKINNLKENIKHEKEKEQTEKEQKLTELEESIKQYLMKYFEKIIDGNYIYYIQEMQFKKKDFERQMQDYKEKLKEQEEFEKTNNLKNTDNILLNESFQTSIEESLKENSQTNLENKENLEKIDKTEIEEKITELSKEINKLNDEKNYNKNQIELLENNLDTVLDTENELTQLNKTIEEMKEQCKILEKTKDYLETAKNQFSSHYLGGMKKSFVKYLKLINGKDLDVSIDVNLNVQITEKGSRQDLNFFSTGVTDLIYICMRLSLIDALFKDEKPFIILDDPFVNLDETKMGNALNLIEQISEKYQVVYFVCHESRAIHK